MAISIDQDCYRLINADGTAAGDIPEITDDRLLAMYRWMVIARTYDDRALSLQRQGRLGTYSPLRGQEASQVGMALAVDPDDWIFPTYRDIAACFVHGLPLEQGFLYGQGVGQGLVIPDSVHIWPRSISIASHIPHAVGMAWGFKLQGKKTATVASFGDGATSKGDFHEAANFAGVFRIPVVLFVQNNQYAISLPRAQQTAAASIAAKAIGYGFDGIRVDGNDVVAVYTAVQAALDKARKGEGPTLIEAETYRLGAHTTADDPTRYRDAEELAQWEVREPVGRFRRFLEGRKLWSAKREEALMAEVRQLIDEAVDRAEREAIPHAEDVFNHSWANPPRRIMEQRAANRHCQGGTH